MKIHPFSFVNYQTSVNSSNNNKIKINRSTQVSCFNRLRACFLRDYQYYHVAWTCAVKSYVLFFSIFETDDALNDCLLQNFFFLTSHVSRIKQFICQASRKYTHMNTFRIIIRNNFLDE